MSCRHCSEKYYGQTSSAMRTRYGKHFPNIKYDRSEKSCETHQVFNFGQSVKLVSNQLKLLKSER